MPETMRTILVGFDPILVRGYVKTGARALWFYLPEELYKEYKVKPGAKVNGKLLHVYGPDGAQAASPNESFEWQASKETGMAVDLPASVITKYGLTEFHFLEMSIDKVDGRDIYPGKAESHKMWPEKEMKLAYSIKYMPP